MPHDALSDYTAGHPLRSMFLPRALTPRNACTLRPKSPRQVVLRGPLSNFVFDAFVYFILLFVSYLRKLLVGHRQKLKHYFEFELEISKN